jgi:hypothetical protein
MQFLIYLQKPVSSLLSHFEQMAKTKPRAPTPSSLSSKPPGPISRGGDPVKAAPHTGENNNYARGRAAEAADRMLQLPQRHNSTSVSPSPTRLRPPRPISSITPAVTVQAPLSPVKTKTATPHLANTSAYLSADGSNTSSGASSPRPFKIPSRPHTPSLEPARSPSLPRSQPPSPPPPRRSGEFRRDAAVKPAPPVLNRAEKPKIASKPMSLQVEPAPIYNSQDKSSPFSTPPGSPEFEPPPPMLPERPKALEPPPALSKALLPPPQRMVVSKRNDNDLNTKGRGLITPQLTGDGRPPLPSRPPSRPQVESMKPRIASQTILLPPPPRASLDRSRPPSSDNSMAPTRVVSGPTAHLSSPPRLHGRSMTVDLTPERPNTIPFRPPVSPVHSSEPRRSMTMAPAPSHFKEDVDQRPMEYPDSSNSNRRPPYFKQGAHEISTKYETRIYDVCGEFICTSGHMTRVWSLLDGDVVMNMAHVEGVKMISVAFKPTADINDEGTKLWLGSNIGDIMEVDVRAQDIVASKANAHSRREIIKIYRHKNEMWTLDDAGTLHLWAPDQTGEPSLSNPYASFRVPKGHTFSIVIGDNLWYAAGKDIRIFRLSMDEKAPFQLLQRPLSQLNTGDVTSGATLSTQPDRIYFGHVDGKVSIYSTIDQFCLALVNVSVYKITSLAGIGGNLWAGFSTGMIYVYDTTTNPWMIKKDWRAHHDPIISLVADKSSFFFLNRAHVISLGQDNMLRMWDGLLQDDWIGTSQVLPLQINSNNSTEDKMQSQEVDFCDLQTIKTLVMTWNAGASTPYHLQHSEQDNRFFKDLLQSSDCPDIIVFGFQELIDLEDKKTTASMYHV